MTRSLIPLLVLTTAAIGSANPDGAPEPEALRYDIVSVHRRLSKETTDGDWQRLAAGDHALSGDRLKTGLWSAAELEVSARSARFHLGPQTRVRLATQVPGILLKVDRGRIRALFDKGDPDAPVERLVATPSAVLAVRGTHYGVEVDSDGYTEVVVFEGVVEVSDLARSALPVAAHAGQVVGIHAGGPPEPPRDHRIGPADWDRGRSAAPHGDGHDGTMPRGMDPSPGSSGSRTPGGHGGGHGRG
jgi:hypothetical protein